MFHLISIYSDFVLPILYSADAGTIGLLIDIISRGTCTLCISGSSLKTSDIDVLELYTTTLLP